MKRFGLLLLCFWVVAAASSGWCATWLVAPNGSDFNGGQDWRFPLQTLQGAIDRASESDEIWVAAGTYTLETYIYLNKSVSV